MILDLSLSTFDVSWPNLVETAVALDGDERYDTLWVFDHLSAAVTGNPRSGVFECFATLAALAAVTERVGLGSLVANVGNRHVGILATTTATIQAISNGRLRVGLGAGSSRGSQFAIEQTMLGLTPAPLAERHQLLMETIGAMKELWGDPDAATDSGRTMIQLNEPDKFLAPVPIPPVTVGLNSARLAALAAPQVEELNAPSSCPELEEIAAIADRHGTKLSVYEWFDRALLDDAHPGRSRLADLGVERMVLVASPPFDHRQLIG